MSTHAAAAGGGTKRRGRRTVRVTLAVSPPLTAIAVKRISESAGSGTHASQAPLGQTLTGAPLIVSVARPVPVDPKRNVESRAATTAPSAGYLTTSASGPVSESMPGNEGLPRTAATLATGTGGAAGWLGAQARRPSITEAAAGRSMGPNYMRTRAYAKAIR